MLLFAASELGSMAKQLVRDALPKVLVTNVGARAMLKGFLTRRLKKGDETDYDLMAEIIVDDEPRDRVIQELVVDLTSSSLQSGEQLLHAASFFDVPSSRISEDPRELKRILGVRNQTAHEMDIDFGQPNRNRRPRARGQIIDNTDELFRVANNFLNEVAAKCE